MERIGVSQEVLNELAENDSLVKLFWTDSTGEERIKKGHIHKIGPDFVKFKTHHNSYFVSRSAITSIQVIEQEAGK